MATTENGDAIPTRELRAAVLHLVDLAACYETRGDAKDSEAERLLRDLTERLLAHKKGIERPREAHETAAMHEELAGLYRRIVKGEIGEAEQREILRDIFRTWGRNGSEELELTPGQLRALLLTPPAIKALGGPANAAATRLAALLDVVPRTVFNRKKDAPPIREPTAFGRRTGVRGVVRYFMLAIGFAEVEAGEVADDLLGGFDDGRSE